jgi:hypothetical protein
MLCGLPLAVTNYSCGEDFCANPDVFPLSWHPYHEQGTNFIKAATDTHDIKRFMTKIWRMTPKDVRVLGERCRAWAKKTFSIETIGAQWEALFDSMPMADWDKISFTTPPKNDQLPLPQIEDEDQFITALYTGILNMAEPTHGDGHKHWKARLKEGMKREDVYSFFLGVARQENAKNQAAPQDFSALLDKTTGRRRILLMIKESIGDVLLVTSLFKSLHRKYDNHDLYVACDPKYFEILDGNPHVFKTIPYQSFMEQEMACIGSSQPLGHNLFDVYLHPAIATQRILHYLSNEYRPILT